jgi:hypothetical protein
MKDRLKQYGFLLPLAALLAGAAVWGLYFTHQYDREQGLNVSDAITTLDLAQVARRVAQGEGITTGFIRPVSLRFHPDYLHHPELTHPPLYILVLAGAFRLFSARDLTVTGVSIVFFWALVPWLWFWGRKIFDDLTASLAVLLYCLNPILLRISINGSPVPFLAFLLFLLFYLLYRGRGDSRLIPAAAGAVIGLAYLTRYSCGLWLFPAGFFLAGEGRDHRLRRLAYLTAGALLVALPWLIRNWVVVGGPFFTLDGFKPSMFSDPRPGYILWRGFSAQSLIVPQRGYFLLKKFLLGLRESYLRVLLLTGNFASVFALLSALHRFPNRKFDRLKYAFFMMLILECGYLSLFSPAGQGTAVFIPGASLLAAAFLLHLLSRFEGRRAVLARTGLAIFFLLLVSIPISDKLGPRGFPRLRLYSVENIREVAAAVPPGEILVSDVPWALSWYGGVNALWLPFRLEDYEEIRLYREPKVAGLFLTPFYGGDFFQPEEISPVWLRVYETGWIPGGWGLEYRTPLPDSHIYISRVPFPNGESEE